MSKDKERSGFERRLRPFLLAIVVMLALLAPGSASAQGMANLSDEELLAWVQGVNEQLAAAGQSVAIEQIEFFTIGPGRPPVRIHQQPFRWVAGDTRRGLGLSGNDITFMLDDLNNPGPTSLGSYPTLELAAAMSTWDGERCLKKVNLLPVPSLGGIDATIFDADLLPGPTGFCPLADVGVPGDGSPFFADIVHAGWYPPVCFGGGTLAFSVTFIFVSAGVPTDINGDNYLDTALNEIYYNDAFSWMTGAAPLPDFDVETVAFHEAGHSLGIGHFGPPPNAVMNPIYAGPRQSPFPIDHAGMCAVWGGWPK